MTSTDEIAEQWFAQTVESYPDMTAHFLATEKDPFRNPVGHALRNGMVALVQELLGEMQRNKIAPALDGIIRIRALQDVAPSEAVGFVFLLRPILLGSNPARPAMLEARIDQLALIAFDHYMACREDLARVRANEAKRKSRIRPALDHN
jgi:RsbT co-antagonist protein rsbRD N-terminal domain